MLSGQGPVKQRTILPPKPRLAGDRQAEKADLCSSEPHLTSVLAGSLPIICPPLLFSKNFGKRKRKHPIYGELKIYCQASKCFNSQIKV